MSNEIVIGPTAYFDLLLERNLISDDARLIDKVDGPDVIRGRDVFGTIPRVSWAQHAQSITEVQWERPAQLKKKNWRHMTLEEMRRCAGPAMVFKPPTLEKIEDAQSSWSQIAKQFEVGTIIEDALILDIRYYGLKIEIDDDVTALLHVSELEKFFPELYDKTNKEKISILRDLYEIGDLIEVEVNDIIHNEHRIHLTLPATVPDAIV